MRGIMAQSPPEAQRGAASPWPSPWIRSGRRSAGAADHQAGGQEDLAGFTFGKTDTGFTTDTWVELWENQAARRPTTGAPSTRP
jgi:hypothetical protein